VCPSDSPICLFSTAARVNASGPSCTLPTPTASNVCSGCRPCTRRPHRRQRPTAISKRRTTVRRTISSWYWVSWRSNSTSPPQRGQCSGSGTRKLFIDARGDGAAGASAVGATGFPAWGSVSVLRENAARLVACSPAAPLPVPDAAARSSDSSARFPASVAGSPSAAVRSAAGLGRVLAWTNSTTSGCSLRSSSLLRSFKYSTVEERSAFEQRNLQEPNLRGFQAGNQIPEMLPEATCVGRMIQWTRRVGSRLGSGAREGLSLRCASS